MEICALVSFILIIKNNMSIYQYKCYEENKKKSIYTNKNRKYLLLKKLKYCKKYIKLLMYNIN